MKSISISKTLLALLLSISLIATGCSAQWISVALADLPVLTQMALNLAALVSTLQSGRQLSLAEAAAIQDISAEANKDLTLLQSLYNAYKANPSPDTLLKIENLIQEVNQNAGIAAGGTHQQSRAVSADHGSGESDCDHGEQLCGTASAIIYASDGGARECGAAKWSCGGRSKGETGHSQSQRLKKSTGI